ncbi:MAG: MFS transporter [Planctomycetaceae bacterium]|nr:MFS transporter [Planctomycetaceae bacterium]
MQNPSHNYLKSGVAGMGFLIILGALTAFDSMSIEMYLPAFTVIQADLGLELGTLQLSLSVFLLGLAVGQAVWGPLADSYGRKTPLLIGIALFGAASAMVAMATGS